MILEEPAENTVAGDHSATPEKKLSYLSLACCVNGYSNLTHYDSKIRQEINKSREVSPIRASTSESIQHCKKSDALTAPVLDKMPDESPKTPPRAKQQENGDHNGEVSGTPNSANKLSFIQQRVERLYGPGALAQGFYTPRKSTSPHLVNSQKRLEATNKEENVCELQVKFKEISPGRDYTVFKKKLDINTATRGPVAIEKSELVCLENVETDLPVFRHLSQEFRAQLPLISPKRYTRYSTTTSLEEQSVNGNHSPTAIDVVDKAVVEEHASITEILQASELSGTETKLIETVCISDKKDGNYFLLILKNEQRHLLSLADEADKYINELANNPEITEDTMGFLRSAAGKARLLVTQKMKQFEGLCYQNLNCSQDDKFPTTVDDLQGFWDMVKLQVSHVHSIFEDLEKLKSNNWQRLNDDIAVIKQTSKTQKSIKAVSASRIAKPLNGNTTKTNGAAAAVALKREEHRKQIAEMKRLHREKMANANSSSNIGTVIDAASSVENNHSKHDGDGDSVGVGIATNKEENS